MSSLLLVVVVVLQFYKLPLADGFSLESEWQQVSSSFQDTS